MHGKSKVFHRVPDWQNVFPRLWFPARQRSRDMTLRLATGDSVDSSDAPVIRSRLNQLELLTGIRMIIRILSYEDHLIDSSDSPVIRYVPDHLELLSEYCHIVILKIILFAKSDPRQTTQTLTKFSTIASKLLLFVLATLKKDIFDKCDVNQTTRTC